MKNATKHNSQHYNQIADSKWNTQVQTNDWHRTWGAIICRALSWGLEDRKWSAVGAFNIFSAIAVGMVRNSELRRRTVRNCEGSEGRWLTSGGTASSRSYENWLTGVTGWPSDAPWSRQSHLHAGCRDPHLLSRLLSSFPRPHSLTALTTHRLRLQFRFEPIFSPFTGVLSPFRISWMRTDFQGQTVPP